MFPLVAIINVAGAIQPPKNPAEGWLKSPSPDVTQLTQEKVEKWHSDFCESMMKHSMMLPIHRCWMSIDVVIANSKHTVFCCENWGPDGMLPYT